ncbi:MAG TPA: cbb3-type cytochrome c oxidase N-terminal domain-containing protein [Anaeromyxobacter sp.]|nr:cbb3-type cytochrome c oxidase N-terminal domain-containing protein [Anaeromyxobacter sp.]
MATQPELDDLSRFEAKDTSRKLPAGWLLLFWGLVVWGAWYLWRYTPALGGWSQSQDLEGGGASTGTNLLATVAFTAIPTVAAIVIVLSQRRKKG